MRDDILIMLVGLPRSGKSTWAREMGFPVVCPDNIRLALHGNRYLALAEPFVWAIAKVMVRALFLSGHSIIVLDATNTTEARRAEWESEDWKVWFRVFDTSEEECIARAAGDKDLIPVIERMASQYEPLTPEEETYLLYAFSQFNKEEPQ